MDYDSTPKNWTLKLLVKALDVDHEVLNPLFAAVNQSFGNNIHTIEPKTHASKDSLSAEAKTLRARCNDLFTNVPAGSKFDKKRVKGCMEFISNNSSSTRAHIKRETPAPSVTPASSSPGGKSACTYSIPTSTLPNDIPEHRLIIEFSRQGSPEVPPLKASAQTLVDRNPSRSEIAAIRLADVTKAAMIKSLIEESTMRSEEDLIWGVNENGDSAQLLSDIRIVGFL